MNFDLRDILDNVERLTEVEVSKGAFELAKEKIGIPLMLLLLFALTLGFIAVYFACFVIVYILGSSLIYWMFIGLSIVVGIYVLYKWFSIRDWKKHVESIIREQIKREVSKYFQGEMVEVKPHVEEEKERV